MAVTTGAGDAAQARPTVELAASSRWLGGAKALHRVRNLGRFLTDEPVQMGGEDAGPNPLEAVLAALNGCLTVMVTRIARELEIAVDRLEIESRGDLDPRGMMGVAGVPRHFRRVEARVRIGTPASDAELEELRRRVEDRCPVSSLLRAAGVELQVAWSRG
ncbi:MAG: OsmC family protein [Firmicutes bacterium]|nr:OsmC family protein [Bacillota bacterium]